MLCDICAKNEATVHLTEIVNEQVKELHLCETCAQTKSMQMEQQFGLSDLLAGLADFDKPLQTQDTFGVECQNCHLTYKDFKKIGRLGCSECYSQFRRYLDSLLKRIHGSNKHMGKAPLKLAQVAKTKKRTLNLGELKEGLRKSIASEEFEEAARLRDAIRQIEGKQTDPDKR
ncbi:MAG: UvrB/UvrC motif-containing protein [Candidatus Omnitrophica bacterium]|nr:UvrB/UvrC motif-containing protein [Candidatus Omnitrophota bacterium]